MSGTEQWICSSRCWQEGGPHDEQCRRVKSGPSGEVDGMREQVDRLARALADGQWWSETTTGWRCDSCREAVSLSAVIHPHIVKHHAPDCVFVWATEYVAALEGQNE